MSLPNYLHRLKEQIRAADWETFRDNLQRYWALNGGWGAVLKSPFLWIAFFIALIGWPIWGTAGWWDMVIEGLPNLLGFSLGVFAFIVGFGHEGFLNRLAGQEPGDTAPSPYAKITAILSHFILTQTLALLVAITLASLHAWPSLGIISWTLTPFRLAAWFVGYWLFIYALTQIGAATLAMFRVVLMFDLLRTNERTDEAAEKAADASKKKTST